jgi:hypothetical protein
MLQRKDQDRHEEQRRDQLQQALGEKVQHGARPSRATERSTPGNRGGGVVPTPLAGEG